VRTNVMYGSAILKICSGDACHSCPVCNVLMCWAGGVGAVDMLLSTCAPLKHATHIL
jgi:hypothetical protein